MADDTAELLNKFAEAQVDLIARLEAKHETLEQMFAAILAGYAEIAAMVEALVEERLVSDDTGAFIALLVEKKKKFIESLQLGKIDAENNARRFTSVDLGSQV